MKTKFFTRNGDDGKSGIGDARKKKSDPLFEFLGEFDLLNSWLGLCRSKSESEDASGWDVDVFLEIQKLQETIFISQAEIAAQGFGLKRPATVIATKHIEFLEDLTERIDEEVPQLSQFVIPGGDDLSATLDIGRAMARRVERLGVAFGEDHEISSEMLQYLNRLSSALFALGRYVNHKKGAEEKSPTYEI